MNHYFRYGHPHIDYLNQIKQDLLVIIYEDNSTNWDKLVQEASECHGNPQKFWQRINHLLGGKERPPTAFPSNA